MNEELLPTPSLDSLIQDTLQKLRNRSYSERHPELGKMINCYVCGDRHRSPQCQPRYKELGYDEDLETGEKTIVYAMASQTTAKGVYGSDKFKKKRFNPHPNRRNLQLVERTKKLFPLYENQTNLDIVFAEDKPLTVEQAMHCARARAHRELQLEWTNKKYKQKHRVKFEKEIELREFSF